MDTNDSFDWARALTDPHAFRREQECLGGVWTLLGLAHDVADDGSWLRATLGGRSVFVQRFGDDLRGFENLCPHRFMPLRTRDRGRGPVRCGFHHWHFNADGEATGIPKCQEMFRCSPRDMKQRLRPVEVAVCGALVFGRFADGGPPGSLESFLGPLFPILETVTRSRTNPRRISLDFDANWRLGVHISLDDYHVVAVHPDTFGKQGYLSPDFVRYHRVGPHNAFFYGTADTVEEMADACRAGVFHPTGYRIVFVFPNLFLLHHEVGGEWQVIVLQYVPRGPGSATYRTWYFPSPFQSASRNVMRRMLQASIRPWLPWVVRIGIRKVGGEDNRICEQIQSTASQIGGAMVLGRHEERIRWFEEAYKEALSRSRAIATEGPMP